MNIINSSSHRLVGKFFTNSTPPSFSETEQSLRKQWILSDDDMIIQEQRDSDTFLFKFRQETNKVKVLVNGPYYVNGVIIVIKDLISSDVLIDFTVASFVIAVLGLPSYFFTKEYLPILKSLLGDYNPVLARRMDRIIFLKVDVDLKKPLRAGFYIGGDNRFVLLKYRNLGYFCYKCGMIGHIKRSCDKVKFAKERALNATSRTHVYGPWLRASHYKRCYEYVLTKSLSEKHNVVRDCEKSLSDAQFFIELEFNKVVACNPRFSSKTMSTHRFRFPCSYLDTKTESTDITTSKAYKIIEKEIHENTPFSLGEFGDIGSLVEQLKLTKKNEFCSDDKWLTLKIQINITYKFMPVDYETMLGVCADNTCERLIGSKISDLIKNRVENDENLLSLPSWENQIREVISEMGFTHYMHEVSTRANEAMLEAVRMKVLSRRCTTSQNISMVSGLERFKVLGSDMDRLDPCVICVEEMFLAEEAAVLPCSHVFHSSCIEKWLQVGYKCPLCGYKLLSPK